MSWNQPLEVGGGDAPQFDGLDIHPAEWAKLCGPEGYVRGRVYRGNASNSNSDVSTVTSVEMVKTLHNILVRIAEHPTLGFGSKGAVLRSALTDLAHYLNVVAPGDVEFQAYLAGQLEDLQAQEELDEANAMLDRFEADMERMKITFERLSRVPDPVSMHRLLDSQYDYWSNKRSPYDVKAITLINGYREKIKGWPRVDTPDDQHARLREQDL